METLHYLLMKAHSTLNRRIMAGAAALGLSPGQPKVLEYLLACGQANQKAIAEYCEIEPATVGAILQRMEAVGLVRRANRQGGPAGGVCEPYLRGGAGGPPDGGGVRKRRGRGGAAAHRRGAGAALRPAGAAVRRRQGR